MKTVNRIMIFGRPGSGKSTFAKKIAEKLNLPLCHLDRWFYTKDWQERNYKEFLAIQKKFVDQKQWVIDGNMMKSLEMRFAKTDIALYFYYPFPICLYRILNRYFFKDQTIKDRPHEYMGEKITWKLISYTWNFDRRYKQQINDLQASYPHVQFYKITHEKELKLFFHHFVTLA